jgi:3-ketosteroid 9alpha-monooxygenase subunit A
MTKPDNAEVHNGAAAPTAVWSVIEAMSEEERRTWRMSAPAGASAEERNLRSEYPFGWFAVGFSDELAAGQVKSIRYFDRELALWRGEDGVARVIDAYCAHYGANMAIGGRVSGSYLECPFHAWRYDGEGAVREIPYSKSVPPRAKRKDCVPSWPTEETDGLIWVWYHPQRAAPMWELMRNPVIGDPDWGPLVKMEWIFHTAGQVLGDNGVDVAHFKFVHGTLTVPDYKFEFDGYERRVNAFLKMATPRGPVNSEINSISRGPGQGFVRYSGLVETAKVSGITPIGPDRLHVMMGFTQPKEQAGGKLGGLANAMLKDLKKQLDQDKVILDHLRRLDNPLICQGDGPLLQNQQYYNQFFVRKDQPTAED